MIVEIKQPPVLRASMNAPELSAETGNPTARYVIEPYMSIEETEDGALITVTAQGETTQATVYNGEAGRDGKDGSDGTDGVSPTASVSKVGGTATITITDKNGTTTASISDGQDGQDGQDGTAATIAVGTTSTGAAGTSASVTNVGTDSAAVLNFVIPKGDKGDTGDRGPAGTTDYNDLINKPTIPSTAADVGALPDSTKYALSASVGGSAKNTEGIPYGTVDSTSTSTVFTATVPGITELKDGTVVMLKNGVITSASGFTINVNNLGAKPVYNNMAAASAETTIFNVNYTLLFVYDSTRVAGGAWINYRGYNSDTNTIAYQIRTNSYSLPMDSVTYRYRLLFTSADGTKFVPANNSTSTNATASRTVCQSKIDPFGAIVYYGTTASVAAGSRPGAAYLWSQYTISLGYSFNRTGAALTMTSWKPVYVKAAPQTDGSAIIDSTTPFVQALPSTADGKIYIFLGVAYSATNIELQNNHPVYYHDGTAIRLWTGKAIPDGLPAVTSLDNGKVLQVVNGAWAATSLPSANGVNF